MKRLGALFVTVFLLSGCGSAARREAFLADLLAAEQQSKTFRETEKLIEEECQQKRLAGELKGHVAAIRCVQERKRDLMIKRGDPHMDLVDLQFAYRIALARRMDEGVLSREDAELLDAELAVRIKAEIERRNMLAHQAQLQAQQARNQQAQLQTRQASEAWRDFIRMLNDNLQRQQDRDALTAPRTMPPITCYQYGNMIQCR